MSAPPIRIGISRCLLGDAVRYDGGHKRDRYLVDVLGRHVTWVPVCPEVEIGLGTPREPIHLEVRRGAIHLVGNASRTDHTAAMRRWARSRADALARANLDGVVLKAGSPSCGPARVPLYRANGRVTRTGRGLFAAALAERLPNLPIEEEGRLADARLRERFIGRVLAYRRLRALWGTRWRIADLVAFHATHRPVLRAHAPEVCRRLERLVGGAQAIPRRRLRERYEASFMAALSGSPMRARGAKVLRQVLGYGSIMSRARDGRGGTRSPIRGPRGPREVTR